MAAAAASGTDPRMEGSSGSNGQSDSVQQQQHDRASTAGAPSGSGAAAAGWQLTVKAKAKVKEFEEQRAAMHRPSMLGWIVLKWTLTLLISLGFLACLVFSKVSAVRLSQELYWNNSEQDSSAARGADAARQPLALVLLIVTLCVPYAVGAFMSAWMGLLRNDVPWPRCSAVLIGLLCATCEVVGSCLFVVVVIPRLLDEGHLSLVVMNSILLLPIIKHSLYDPVRACCDRRRNSAGVSTVAPAMTTVQTLALYGAALLFQIAGQTLLAAVYIGDVLSKDYPMETKLCLVASMLLVSLAWLPVLQKLQLRPPDVSVSHATTTSSATGSYVRLPENAEHGTAASSYSARHKACFIANVYKLLLTPAMAILIVYVRYQLGIRINAFPVEDLRLVTLQEFTSPSSAAIIDWFALNVVSSFVGYMLGMIACMMCMQVAAFAIPLTLATPVALVTCYLISNCSDGLRDIGGCSLPSFTDDLNDLKWVIPPAGCLWVAQILSTLVDIFRSQPIVMEKEGKLFWLCGYSSLFLEQFMLLGRRTHKTDELRLNPSEARKRVRVFICTTMYREEEHEMEQLLVSLAAVNSAQLQRGNFEAHIFFDNGVKGKKLTEFALQLISLVSRTLGVQLAHCTKVATPYGMSLNWQLPGGGQTTSSSGMRFSVHLKDNLKVKNKKRWSQIMYMSMVLDYFLAGDRHADDMESFILTTDADVKFNRDSVEVLLDLMMRNTDVGAVCARTYPMGSGPVVWYQIFDYAIGHWFQKAAEHVLGTVLCCPGCFSVYRMKALRQVVPLYASKVNQASEFLTKDMGEDRWLCTLMVQAGWRLEYSAVAVDGTHCPEEFEEFYKQRRRWIPSTLANQVLLLQQWELAQAFNNNISILFLLYQGLLIFSTLITPSMTVLVISGGLEYGWGVPAIASIIIMIVIIAGYGFVCLKLSSDTQLWVAKVLTFIFAIVMCSAGIGIAVQVAGELAGTTCQPPPTTSSGTLHAGLPPGSTSSADAAAAGTDLALAMLVAPNSTLAPCKYTPVIPGTAINFSTLYLAVLVGMYLVTGMLHPTEFYCLIHGLWYLLCLPSGYLFLMIYSLCNITDNSWGTREDKSKIALSGNDESLTERLKAFFSHLFSKCLKSPAAPSGAPTGNLAAPQPAAANSRTNSMIPGTPNRTNSFIETDQTARAQASSDRQPQAEDDSSGEDEPGAETFRFPGDRPQHHQLHAQQSYMPTDEWLRELDPRFEELYVHKFMGEGYSDTSFIASISDAELKALHIDNDYHRKILLDASKYLEEPDVDVIVPKDPSEWLQMLGLGEYTQQFKLNHIRGEKGLERLKNMKQKEIEQILKIYKRGHMRRLLQGIKCLRYPTERENRIRSARADLDRIPTTELSVVSPQEADFWEELRQACLLPEPLVFGHEAQLKDKLVELRNSTLMAFIVANVLWLILMLTLDYKVSLYINGANPLGVSFLFIFGIVMVAQFASMIFHRLTTTLHFIARAPFSPSKPWQSDFSFSQAFEDGSGRPSDNDLQEVRQLALRFRGSRPSRRQDGRSNERTPLLAAAEPLAEGGRIV